LAVSFELFLAWRYLYSRRRRALARVTGAAAVLSVALGVAALLLALALGRGWQEEIRDKILSGTAHIVVTRKNGAALPDWRVYARQMRGVAGVARVSGTSYEGALITGANGATYAVLRGVAGDDEAAISQARAALTEGGFSPQDKPGQAVIGVALAERAGLRVGDAAEIVTGAEALAGGEARRLKARVAGLVRTGWHEADAAWVYVSLPLAARAAGAEGDAATALNAQLQNPYEAGAVSAELRQMLGADFLVTDWRETNRPLFAALSLERRAAFFVVALLFALAALNLLATLVLVVAERRGDIAILGALGARARSIALIFLLEGAFIGLLGAMCGVALGLALCWLGNRYRWVSLPAEIYALSYAPFRWRAEDVVWTVAAALIFSLLATIYPACAASRLRPAEALKDGKH
jgi:lipoprotein-releasing system permease protein